MIEWTDYVRFILALLFVLALIGGLSLLARRFGLTPRATASGGRAERRLAIVEVAPVDAKHRLILVRRDDRESLILLGPTADLLVEADIPAPGAPEALKPTLVRSGT